MKKFYLSLIAIFYGVMANASGGGSFTTRGENIVNSIIDGLSGPLGIAVATLCAMIIALTYMFGSDRAKGWAVKFIIGATVFFGAGAIVALFVG